MLGLIANLRTMTKLVITFSVILLVGIAVNLISVNSSTHQQEATRWTEHTFRVLRAVDDMISGMVNQETGPRCRGEGLEHGRVGQGNRLDAKCRHC